MEKPSRHKSKTMKPPKQPSQAKVKPAKRKCEGGTCSTFLADLTRRFTLKRRREHIEGEEEETKNVVQTIIDSLTNALPVKLTKRSPTKKQSPVKIDTLQNYAPELLVNTTLEVPPVETMESEVAVTVLASEATMSSNLPRMPVVDSEVLKPPVKKGKVRTEDIAVSTQENDLANEIAKHVGTLKKISLIAEEFNKKTAKNLKEIVESVQEDLVKKLQEIEDEQRAHERQVQDASVVSTA